MPASVTVPLTAGHGCRSKRSGPPAEAVVPLPVGVREKRAEERQSRG
jgi:hypothetical protein